MFSIFLFTIISCSTSEFQYDFPSTHKNIDKYIEDTGHDTSNSTNYYFFQPLEQSNIFGAGIWNGLAPFDENEFFFSTMATKDLTLRKLSTEDLHVTSSVITIANLDDIDEDDHITDHAILRVEDTLYFVFGTNNLDDMYLLSTDLEGNRISLVMAQEDGEHPTQDPHLFTDKERICVRWGSDGFEKKVHCRSLDLTEILLDTIVTTPTPIPKLGATLWHNDEFWTFTGDAPQRNLIYSRYDTDFIPLTDPFETIVLASQNNEWNWFCSGVLYIDDYDLWIIAYIHMEADQEADIDGRGRLDLFDGNFNLLDRHFYGTTATYRPHLLFIEPYLFIGYDHEYVSVEKIKIVSE